MKVFKYFILSLSLFAGISSMEQPKVVSEKTEPVKFSSLPNDIWNIIIQRHLIDEEAFKEKDIFKDMDNLRLTSKDSKTAVDELVNKVGKDKKKPNYTYAEFKADIMDKILDHYAKTHRALGDKLNIAMLSLANNWAHYYLNNPDQKVIDLRLLDKIINLSTNAVLLLDENLQSQYIGEIRFLLNLGANPNKHILNAQNGASLLLNILIIKILDFIDRYSQFKKYIDNRLRTIKILLDYNANPNLKDNFLNETPLSYAKKELSKVEKEPKSLQDVNTNTEIVLKQIIKLFEAAIEKQEELKKQK